jgi:hypothetical protein
MLIDDHRRSNDMPKGPRGEKRPADVIGGAVKVMRIATGEETEELDQTPASAGLSRPLQPG